MKVRQAVRICAWVAVGLSLVSGESLAQGYPNKAISLIVPFGPGSGNDVIARIVAHKVSDNWSQPVVVENRV